MMYSMLKGLQCIVGRFRSRQPSCSHFKANVREFFSFFTAKKKDGLTVLAIFNLCPKIKKVLHQIWRSSWWSKNPRFVLLSFVRSLQANRVPIIYKQGRRFKGWLKKTWVANTWFLVALATSDRVVVIELFAPLRWPSFDKTQNGNNQIARLCVKARLLIATVFERKKKETRVTTANY